LPDTLEQIRREIRARIAELAPLAEEYEALTRAAAALRMGREPLAWDVAEPEAEAPVVWDVAPAPEAPPPPPRRPPLRKRPGSRPTLEAVRDAARELGDFNMAQLAEKLGAGVGQVRPHVLELVARGTLERSGAARGPSVRWTFLKPAPVAPLISSAPAERTPGWKQDGTVPYTGTFGVPDRPGATRDLQAKIGRKVTRGVKRDT
jgi:hypothetical protein